MNKIKNKCMLTAVTDVRSVSICFTHSNRILIRNKKKPVAALALGHCDCWWKLVCFWGEHLTNGNDGISQSCHWIVYCQFSLKPRLCPFLHCVRSSITSVPPLPWDVLTTSRSGLRWTMTMTWRALDPTMRMTWLAARRRRMEMISILVPCFGLPRPAGPTKL